MRKTALYLFCWFIVFIQVIFLILITLALAESSKDVSPLKETTAALRSFYTTRRGVFVPLICTSIYFFQTVVFVTSTFAQSATITHR